MFPCHSMLWNGDRTPRLAHQRGLLWGGRCSHPRACLARSPAQRTWARPGLETFLLYRRDDYIYFLDSREN